MTSGRRPVGAGRDQPLRHLRLLRPTTLADSLLTSAPLMRQMPLAIAPQPAPTFENFLGGSNAAVLAALRRRPLPAAPTYL
ncbi:MAG: hypothetical protein RLZZ598_1288, partial [Pseudomonadota bacterium]